MASKLILLEAKDCCPFLKQEGHGDAIQYFLATQSQSNIFHFNTSKEKRVDESPIISFNYQNAQWCAGRYVGEAYFNYKGQEYHIQITPRFGNTQLFHMLEEVFNIRFNQSNQKVSKQEDIQFVIKKIIAFLWLNMLSKANKHGLPRSNKKYTYKGSKIRGKLNVRASVLPMHTENSVVSNYWEKTANEPILKILKQAHNILKYGYGLAHIKKSQAATNALEQLFTSNITKGYLTDNEYKKIVYKNIYKSYKPVVDLSWDIIKRKNFGNNKSEDTNGVSFFLDIAEIWELYLVNIIKKKLAPQGWVLRNDVIQTYANKDFRRKLIPDIVFQKDNNVVVWDAKYKTMEYVYYDYDRADFFQIHTYINHYEKNYNVIAGGLLYPLSKEYSSDVASKNSSESIFGEEQDSTQFFVDGIELVHTDKESMKKQEALFLDRLYLRINKQVVAYG
jgi:hypothetical protein